jgi:hypothetical protein
LWLLDTAEVGSVLAAHAVDRMALSAPLRLEELGAGDRILGWGEGVLCRCNPESAEDGERDGKECRALSHALARSSLLADGKHANSWPLFFSGSTLGDSVSRM